MVPFMTSDAERKVLLPTTTEVMGHISKVATKATVDVALWCKGLLLGGVHSLNQMSMHLAPMPALQTTNSLDRKSKPINTLDHMSKTTIRIDHMSMQPVLLPDHLVWSHRCIELMIDVNFRLNPETQVF